MSEPIEKTKGLTPEVEGAIIATWIEIQIQERKLSELQDQFKQLSAKAGVAKFKLRLEPEPEVPKGQVLRKV
jgi:hypothetical protein